MNNAHIAFEIGGYNQIHLFLTHCQNRSVMYYDHHA
jgi:hypothetical protein